MANPSGGFGLRAVRRLDGAALSFQMEERQIAFDEADVMATGDLVKSLGTGFIELFDAADVRSAGVFMGCTYFDPNIGRKLWLPQWNAPTLPSSTVVKAWIIIDPMIVWEMRVNGASAVGIASLNANADIDYQAPDTLSGQARSLLDASTIAVTATLPLRIVALGAGVGNDNESEDNIVQVALNTVDIRLAAGL